MRASTPCTRTSLTPSLFKMLCIASKRFFVSFLYYSYRLGLAFPGFFDVMGTSRVNYRDTSRYDCIKIMT